MWNVVCIRKCVGGRWSVEGRCMLDGGDASDVVRPVEVPSCVCVWSCCWARMQLVAGLAGWEGLSGPLCEKTGLRDARREHKVGLLSQRHRNGIEWKGLRHWFCDVE